MMRRNLLSESVASVSSLPANTVFKLGTNGLVGAQNNIFLDTPTNSRTANTITRYGNATQGTFTPYSKEAGKWSNYFNGAASDYLAATALQTLGTSDFEIDVDIFAISAQSNGGVILETRSPLTGLLLAVNSNVSVVFLAVGNTEITLNTAIVKNKWVRLKVKKVSNIIDVIVDGVSATTKGSSSVNLTDTKINIGASTNFANSGFGGYISNLKITKAGVVVLDTCKDNRFKDNSGFNHTLTPTGNVKISPFSPYANSVGYDPMAYGGSGYFDGNGDYLSMPSTTPIYDAPIIVSFSCFPVTGWLPIIDKSCNGSNCEQTLRIQSGTLFFDSRNSHGGSSVTWSTPVGSIPNFVWSHVDIEFNNSDTRVYINGILIGSYAAKLWTNLLNRPLLIGKTNFSSDSGGNGYISNLRITKAGTEVLNLKFNNAGIRDLSGMNNIETVGDAKVSSDGQGVVFDGSGDYLSVTSNPTFAFGTGDFSVEADIYPNNYTNFPIFQAESNLSSANGTFWFGVFGGSLTTSIHGSGAYTVSYAMSLSSQWYKVKTERVSGVIKMYVNGILVVTNTTLWNGVSVGMNGNPTIGAITNGGSTPYTNGTIKNLTITKGA